jgi:hypothetical protein
MSDETNDPQPSDPPTNTGGGGGTSETEDYQALDGGGDKGDPPTNTGGGGSA